MSKGLGSVQKKFILILATGAALSLTRSPKGYYRIISSAQKEWNKLHRESIAQAIRSLYNSGLITERTNSNGSITLSLTREGKKCVTTCHLDQMSVARPKKWDKKWRMVLFDIPEEQKKTRDVFRKYLKDLKFYELQKSVFVHPYDCAKEINYLIEFYGVRRYVRYVVAETVDNGFHLKHHFKL